MKGKLIRGRKLQEIQNCRKGCITKVSEEMRNKIFNEYWNIGNYDKRISYTASLILKEEKKTEKVNAKKSRTCNYKFLLRVSGALIKVCK